jgi:acyl carrier protein
VIPLTGAADDRVYRTGDLGRYRVDGTVEFCGRRDEQVKIRGVRIELADVGVALARHGAVREAAVVVQTAPTGEPQLVAYVVAPGALAPGPDELRAHLRQQLPEVMVPSAFVAVPRLPLTPNGKIDRAALPAAPPPARDRRRPQTPTEVTIAAIWTEVMGLEEIGADDDFFELGGHSLMATRVLARLRQRLEVELPLRALFEAPTVGALAGVLDAWHASAVSNEREEIEL